MPNANDTTGRNAVTTVGEWQEVEELIMTYKKQFEEGHTEEEKKLADVACLKLLQQFYPLFRQYCNLITGKHWSACMAENKEPFGSAEIRLFFSTFIDDSYTKKELHRYNPGQKAQQEVFHRMNFVKETYGSIGEEEIFADLQMMFLRMAKRYKPLGKSFCAYINRGYGYEVSRHIKTYIKNPISIPYRQTEYENYMHSTMDSEIEESHFEDGYYYEMATGIPGPDWIKGISCSDMFSTLSPTDRKILLKYYLEDWNDRQIAEYLGIHINTVNQKRRLAIGKVAGQAGFDSQDIIRCRKSGRQAVLPIQH